MAEAAAAARVNILQKTDPLEWGPNPSMSSVEGGQETRGGPRGARSPRRSPRRMCTSKYISKTKS